MTTHSLSQLSRESVNEAIGIAQRQMIAQGQTQWFHALERAQKYLARNLWAFDGVNLTVRSSKHDTVYHVTPQGCECVAYQRGIPCWHRAARKALVNAMTLDFESKLEAALPRISPAERAVDALNERAADAEYEAMTDAINADLY